MYARYSSVFLCAIYSLSIPRYGRYLVSSVGLEPTFVCLKGRCHSRLDHELLVEIVGFEPDDLLLARKLLYQAELYPQIWSQDRGSNPDVILTTDAYCRCTISAW